MLELMLDLLDRASRGFLFASSIQRNAPGDSEKAYNFFGAQRSTWDFHWCFCFTCPAFWP